MPGREIINPMNIHSKAWSIILEGELELVWLSGVRFEMTRLT
jgi:hypothetical protein